MIKIDGKMGLYGLLISLLLQLSVVSISPAEAEEEMRDLSLIHI